MARKKPEAPPASPVEEQTAEHSPFLPLYDSPGYLLRRGGQFITAHFDAEMGHMGLTSSQLAVFLAVHVKEGMEQRELAAALNWDEATVGGMVRRLEAQGLLSRRSSPRSKRGMQIHLSEKGHDLYKRAKPHVDNVQKNVLQALEAEERVQLLRLLSKMMGEKNSHYAGKG